MTTGKTIALTRWTRPQTSTGIWITWGSSWNEDWQDGFPGGSDCKETACTAGDPGLIPGLGRSFGEGNGYPFQYSFLENPMDRGVWQAAVHGVTKSQTQLSDFTFNMSGSGLRFCISVTSFTGQSSDHPPNQLQISEWWLCMLEFKKHCPINNA